MKKTLTVNLSGTVFHIDEDAYRLLDNYLTNLKAHFRKEDGAEEIVDDIEQRISELFSERISGMKQVITIADVEEVIARVGSPEEMDSETSNGYSHEKTSDNVSGDKVSSEQQEQGKTRRKLYRNPDDKILGGVIGGLSVYLGLDATILRLLLLVILVCGYGTLAIIYLICWLIIPEAQTAAEKLNMRGEAVTIENIGKTVTDGFEKASKDVKDYVKSEKPRTTLQKVGDVFVNIVATLFKICMIIFVIICSPVLFAIAVAFVAMLFAAFVVALSGGAALMELFPMLQVTLPAQPLSAIVMYIAGILVVGIPLFVLVWCVFSALFGWKTINNGLKWTLLLLWIVSWAVFGICFTMQGTVLPDLGIFNQTV
ncbi:MAG: PspC domain-containing protein [Bacteroides sp.]|nr:PspC domain-containing protein [Bacteroides sp.]